MSSSRRDFLKRSAATATGLGLAVVGTTWFDRLFSPKPRPSSPPTSTAPAMPVDTVNAPLPKVTKSLPFPKSTAIEKSASYAGELLIPNLQIASHPSIKLSDIRHRRYYIVDRAQVGAADAIRCAEDTAIFQSMAPRAI